jgi:hypothetical protein
VERTTTDENTAIVRNKGNLVPKGLGCIITPRSIS